MSQEFSNIPIGTSNSDNNPTSSNRTINNAANVNTNNGINSNINNGGMVGDGNANQNARPTTRNNNANVNIRGINVEYTITYMVNVHLDRVTARAVGSTNPAGYPNAVMNYSMAELLNNYRPNTSRYAYPFYVPPPSRDALNDIVDAAARPRRNGYFPNIPTARGSGRGRGCLYGRGRGRGTYPRGNGSGDGYGSYVHNRGGNHGAFPTANGNANSGIGPNSSGHRSTGHHNTHHFGRGFAGGNRGNTARIHCDIIEAHEIMPSDPFYQCISLIVAHVLSGEFEQRPFNHRFDMVVNITYRGVEIRGINFELFETDGDFFRHLTYF